MNANNAEVVPVHMMQGPSLLFDKSSRDRLSPSAWARSRGGEKFRNQGLMRSKKSEASGLARAVRQR